MFQDVKWKTAIVYKMPLAKASELWKMVIILYYLTILDVDNSTQRKKEFGKLSSEIQATCHKAQCHLHPVAIIYL